MKLITKCFGAAALAVIALLAPLAHAQQPAGQMDMKGMKGMQGMQGMMKENDGKMSAMQMTGKPDVDFAMMMREHHKGALTMAETELKDGKDRGMRDMAKKIIAAQKKEIAQFDSYLAKNGHGAGKNMTRDPSN